MEENRRNRLLWAAALILAGTLLLLFNLDLLAAYEPTAQIVLAGLLGAGGLGFLLATIGRRAQWWRLMPGWTLLALAAMTLLATQPDVPRPLIAALLFVGLALAFAHVYLVARGEHWWAIIPGGFMLILAGVISLSIFTARLETLGAVLFVGMGLVFALVYLLGGQRHWWAVIPGMVLVLFGLLLYTVDRQTGDGALTTFLLRWWPIAPILVGFWLAYRGVSGGTPHAEKLSVNVAPGNKAESPPLRERLGEYSQPAPGATIDILPDPDERSTSKR
jgi:hypothetical protein